MTTHRVRSRLRSAAGATAIALSGLTPLYASVASHAQGAHPFASFRGRWLGAGALARDDGSVERLRCQADYRPIQTTRLRLTISCRGDSTNVDLQTDVSESAGALSGEWIEANRNIRGDLAGRLTGNSIVARVAGAGFAANVSVGVRSNVQSVEIRAQGGDISRLSISLTRSVR
ncbi:MAG TPA: hypothetical protein VIL72_03000 [Beijerinckiaceae bacterium]